jgi:hypothetical protein
VRVPAFGPFRRTSRQRTGYPFHVVHLRPAIERDVAASGKRPHGALGHRAGQRLHVEIVGQQQAVEADPLADDLLDHERRLGGGMIGIPCGEDEMPGHADRRVIERAERGNVPFQLLVARRHGRQRLVRIDAGAAMARHVLDRSGDARAGETIEHRAPQRRDAQRLAAQRAIADNVVRVRLAHVEQRRMGAGDADFGQIEAQRLGIGARRLDRGGGSEVIEPVEHSRRRDSAAIAAPSSAGRARLPGRW